MSASSQDEFLRLSSSQMRLRTRDCSITQRAFLNINRSGYSAVWLLHGWCHASETAAVSAQVLYTPYSNAPGLRCGFIRNCVYVGRMCVSRGSVAVTCHLHIWQNGRDLAAVTWGWNGYRNKCQHRKFTLEKERKKISRHSCRASNPTPFDHESVAVPLSPQL